MKTEKTIWKDGYVQVYTGTGKGKTTAAFGLAMRAAGAGLPVFIGQFVKGMEYSEIKAFWRFSDLITVKQYGRRCFIYKEPEEEDRRLATEGLEEARRALTSGKYKVVILDEANIAAYFKLFSIDNLLAVIAAKPADVELVITGRNADPRLLERADLVTDMREVKHYYTKGVQAREGIES